MGQMFVQLSPTKLILCDWQGKELEVDHPEEDLQVLAKLNSESSDSNACFGNSLYDAFRYLFLLGTCTEQCLPYTQHLGVHAKYQELSQFENPAQIPLCTQITGPYGDMCSDYFLNEQTGEELGTPERFYRALHFFAIAGTPENGGDEFLIRHNVFHWGPVATGFQVYPDFYTFDAKTEIYKWNGEGPVVGGHAVVILGWGTSEDGVKYWILKNTWGKDWGMNGYFRMVRGENNCQIEANVVGAVPDFFYPVGYQIPDNLKYGESEAMIEARKNIDTYTEKAAGGIDPTTGYTRRTMLLYPWIDYSRPVDLEDLPDWDKFVAGVDATVENRALYQAVVRERNSDIRYSRQSRSIYMATMVLLLFLSVVLITMIVMRRK